MNGAMMSFLRPSCAFLGSAALLSLALAGCTGGTTDESGDTGVHTGTDSRGRSAGPTFHKDIEPILQKSCQNCHSPGNIAPFSLMTYGDAKTVAALMEEQTAKRTMPPWGAFETQECKPRFGWREDLRLSDDQI